MCVCGNFLMWFQKPREWRKLIKHWTSGVSRHSPEHTNEMNRLSQSRNESKWIAANPALAVVSWRCRWSSDLNGRLKSSQRDLWRGRTVIRPSALQEKRIEGRLTSRKVYHRSRVSREQWPSNVSTLWVTASWQLITHTHTHRRVEQDDRTGKRIKTLLIKHFHLCT